VTGVAAKPEIDMARPKRSWNSHETKTRAFPFVARMRREELFRSADETEWQAEADRIAGGADFWYSRAGWKQDYGFKLIGFATRDQADEMQQWIATSDIETRPAPSRYDGPMLTVAGVKPS
jgi:hypothetical protein